MRTFSRFPTPRFLPRIFSVGPVALLLMCQTPTWAEATKPTPSQEKAPKSASESVLYQSVLRIESVAQVFDYRAPWNAGRFGGGSGTGFLVGENKILTNAHVISNCRRLIVRKHGDPAVYPARILHIAHDCDLALIALENPAPLKGIAKLALGDVPALESEVRVIGYPIGGERLSVTRGVVSRIDFNSYSHTGVDQHLVVQIDAAINPGNSGGPVLQGDKVVGVAFQGLMQADNTGYMIPIPVVSRFLKDVEDGHYDNYVDLAFTEFELVNPAQRAALGLPDNNRGILVTRVAPLGSADGKLLPGDILLSLGDHPIFSNGQVRIDGQMVNMHEVVERKFSGDKVSIDYLRAGKPGNTEVTLTQFFPARLFASEYESRPAYAVFGGLVFQPLSRNMLAAYGFESLEVRYMLDRYLPDALYKEWKDIVVLSQVLPDEINNEVASLSGMIIDEINGTKIRSMESLLEVLFTPLEKQTLPEFILIKTLGSNRPIVLEGAKVQEAQKRIRAKYGLPKDHFPGGAGKGLEW